MYNKVDTSLNFVEREKEIIDFWKENKVFEKSVESAPADYALSMVTMERMEDSHGV